MSEDDFKFLIMRNTENGLVFVALDSVVGYIRHLARELENVSEYTDDPTGTSIIAKSFNLLSNRIEEMESETGGGRINDI